MLFKKYIFSKKLLSKIRNLNNKKKLFFTQNFFKKNYSKYLLQKIFNKYFIFYFFYFDLKKVQLQKNFGICLKKKIKNNLLNLNFIQFKEQKYIFYNFYLNFLNFDKSN